jgi:hypothetical protein
MNGAVLADSGPLGSRVFAMLLRTYVDDSADETQEQAVVAGAYVGFYHQWNGLTTKWKKRLKRDNVQFFHASALGGLRGPFSVFADPVAYPKPAGRTAANNLLNDLEAIIHESQVMGVAVCIDMAEYRGIRATEIRAAEIFPPDAFDAALEALYEMCAEIVRDQFDVVPRKIAFVCDESESSARIASAYAKYKREHSELGEYMGDLVHQDDKKTPPLQTADLLAHLAKGRFIEWLNDPAKQIFTSDERLKERLKRLSVHQFAVWTREYMLNKLARERSKQT